MNKQKASLMASSMVSLNGLLVNLTDDFFNGILHGLFHGFLDGLLLDLTERFFDGILHNSFNSTGIDSVDGLLVSLVDDRFNDMLYGFFDGIQPAFLNGFLLASRIVCFMLLC